MTRLYIRAGMSPLVPIDMGRAIQENAFGANSGNLVFQYSVFRTLMRDDTEFDARLITPVYRAPGGVEALNEACDYAVFPLANAFRPGFNLKPMTDMIRRLTIPCVVIGCGLQADSIEEMRAGFPFDEDVKDFVSAVLDKSALLGLRGEFTAEYLRRLGFAPERHFTVIGCPSLFLNGPVMPQPKPKPIDRGTRFSINTRMVQNPALNGMIAAAEAEFPDYHLVLQMQRELSMIAYGEPNPVSNPGRDATGFYPFSARHRDVRNGRAIGFTEARAWFEYMKGIDYSFGSRIHGNISAVINGVPAFVFTSDTRTEELCRRANIAHMPLDQLKSPARIQDILEKADFAAVCRGHRERFDHYVDFLNQNGLPHIYMESPNPARVPFDEAMARLPVNGCVRRGCLSASEAARRLSVALLDKVKRRLKRKK